MNKRGWLVWTWGKMGSLLVFTGIMLMMLMVYSFASAGAQSDGANQVARDLKNLITDTYNSAGAMNLEHRLPDNIDGEDYSVEVLNKSGETAGIIVRTHSGSREVVGGASLSIPMSHSSFGMLKLLGERSPYICITKYRGRIYLERSKCS